MSSLFEPFGRSGLGVQPPTPDWGAMITAARSYLRAVLVRRCSGLALTVTVAGLDLLGDCLRDGLDPRLRERPPDKKSARHIVGHQDLVRYPMLSTIFCARVWRPVPFGCSQP